jgi:hypothetical protein
MHEFIIQSSAYKRTRTKLSVFEANNSLALIKAHHVFDTGTGEMIKLIVTTSKCS